MASCRGRLLAEMREAMRSNDPDVNFVVDQDNICLWQAFIKGPPHTPFEGGVFELAIKCPPSFPIKPPSVMFKTPVFHPNINFETGEVCVDVLKAAWSPVWTLSCLCHAIISLMTDPNPESPLNCDAGNLIRSGDMRGYHSLARMYTIQNAMGKNFAES